MIVTKQPEEQRETVNTEAKPARCLSGPNLLGALGVQQVKISDAQREVLCEIGQTEYS